MCCCRFPGLVAALAALLSASVTLAGEPEARAARHGDAPIITWASDPARPDDTLILAGGNFTQPITVEAFRLADSAGKTAEFRTDNDDLGDRTGWTEIKPIQVSRTAVKFVLPARWKMGVFACRVAAGQSHSKPVLVNAPDPWWMQGDRGESASPGGQLRILGKSLGFGDGSEVVLRKGTEPPVRVKPSRADGYSLAIDLPSSLAPGSYRVSVHNGFGDRHGWRSAGDIRIAQAEPWPKDVFDAKTLCLASALAKARQNGGGVVYFPRGQYEMKGPIELPPRTVLRGEGSGLANIYWADMTNPPQALITGTSFAVENIAIFVAGYHHDVIGDSPQSDGVRIQNVRVRANAFFQLAAPGQEWRNKRAIDDIQKTGAAVHWRGSNFRMVDCDVLGTHKGIEFSRSRGGLVARSRIRYGVQGLAIESTDRLIVEDNQISGGHLSSTGNAFSSFFSPCAQNLYFARNKLENIYGYDSEAMTFDGAGGAYFGTAATVEGTRIVLAADPKPRTYSRPAMRDWTGAALCIFEGKGAGQYRRVAHNDGRFWEVDRPWDIVPDNKSLISIVPFRGRVLFIGNTVEDGGSVQAYGTGLDCVFANNRMIRAGGLNCWGRNPHGWGWQPSWFCQFLDNHVVEGTRWGNQKIYIATFTTNVEEDDAESGGSGKNIEFWGPLARCSVHRRYTLENNATIDIDGTTVDTVVEHCQIRKTDVGITVGKDPRDIVLRKNTFQDVPKPFSGPGLDHALRLSE